MIAIIGLGNPGREYNWTRHNIGFEVVGKLAYDNDINMNKEKYKAIVGEGRIGNEKVLLIQPLTYMNLSGDSVREFVNFYKLSPEQLIVIYDDISLSPGQIRIRKKGSAGGHNGIKNIIAHLGTQVFPRIKVGVGEKPKKYDLADYVLSHFTKAERKEMEEGYQKAIQAVEKILAGEMEAAMNEFNRKVKPKEA